MAIVFFRLRVLAQPRGLCLVLFRLSVHWLLVAAVLVEIQFTLVAAVAVAQEQWLCIQHLV
jgi:hypothetical protein